MALPHATPGQTIRILPPGAAPGDTLSRALVLGDQLEVLRMTLSAGDSLPLHRLKEEATLQCLSGSVEVEMGERMQRLRAGELLCLPRHALYALHADEECLLLMTVVRAHQEGWIEGTV